MADLTHAPRRTAPRVVVLAALGVGSIVLGLALLVVLVGRNAMDYKDWPEGSSVPQDGASHVVRVEPGSTFHVWVLGIQDTADCEVVQAPSGEPVQLRKSSVEAGRASGGRPVHLAALRIFAR